MRETERTVWILLLAEVLIGLTNGNTVDQMLEQMRNASVLPVNLEEVEAFMQEFQDRYLMNGQSLTSHQISFWLYTRDNPDYRQVLLNDPDSIMDSHFSVDKKTVVLVHGWLNAGNASFPRELKHIYLSKHDYNIICVDWSDIASSLIYPFARYSIKNIGTQIATLLTTIVHTTGYDFADFHLVGHSLGAHVCGIAGENVGKEKIGRITGLDPALPLFDSSTVGRLDATDAEFVDIIHTCGKYLGYSEPCGHVDFYPNGGTFSQPGCGFDLGTCSHTRSYEYFAESLTTDTGFYAQQCDSWDDYRSGQCNGTAAYTKATPSDTVICKTITICNKTEGYNNTEFCYETTVCNNGTTYSEAESGTTSNTGSETCQKTGSEEPRPVMILMGDNVNTSARGKFYLMTASSKPYALGRYMPPKLDESPPSSRQDSGEWFAEWKNLRNFINALISVKVNTFSWGVLSNSVYSWFQV